MEISKYIEHKNFNNKATLKDIEKLCNEAIKYKLESVCVEPYYVPLASQLLKDKNIEVATLIGYPSGLNTVSTKSYEAIEAINNGATEINLIVNISAIKNKDFEYIKDEIEEIRDSIDGKTLKIVLDIKNLDEEEIIKLMKICNETFVNYIELEYDLDKLNIVLQNKGEVLEVKVDNVSSLEDLEKLIELGITRVEMANCIDIMEVKK